MKRIFALLAAVLVSGVVCAQAGEAKVPSVLGTWSSPLYTVSFTGGAARSDGALFITKQTGPDFSGYMTWKNLDNGRTGKEAFAGTFDYDGKNFVIAQEDGGTMKGTMTGKNTMQMLVWQSASPKGVTVTFRAVFERK